MLREWVLGAGGEAGRQCGHLGLVQAGAHEAWEVGAVRVHQDELADGVAGCGEKGVLPSSSRSLWSPLHFRTSPLILWLRWWVKLTSPNSQSGKCRGRNNPVLSESETPALPTLCFFSSLLSAQFQEFMLALSFPFHFPGCPRRC